MEWLPEESSTRVTGNGTIRHNEFEPANKNIEFSENQELLLHNTSFRKLIILIVLLIYCLCFLSTVYRVLYIYSGCFLSLLLASASFLFWSGQS